MTKVSDAANRTGLSRREVIARALKTMVALNVVPPISAEAFAAISAPRIINIMNFIRAEEPRQTMDLVLPVRKQMEVIKTYEFPATWLLQYDAMLEGPFVKLLKDQMPPDHETGIWFEMNRKICDDAGIAWRGNPQWEWDYHVPVAYAIGYTPDERRKLADTAMATFKRIFGKDAKTVASWNLDAISIAHLSDHYGIDALGNCRDQLATDGFTIWGAPIAAYYPSRNNAWSPALTAKNQISTPMFRLLGQDPVYYYDNQLPYPDTMEPVWPSGQSRTFVDRFFDMTAHAPTQSLAYAQLGQENSFGWPMMSEAFEMQMEKLKQVQKEGVVIIETMGETGRRFKHSFQSTPTQAQVMLTDPFGKEQLPQRTIWYQSKYYRANLHFRGDQFYLRDLHVYSDEFVQPYLTDPVRQHGIEQRLLAILDGYHWSDDEVRAGGDGLRAMGQFVSVGDDGKDAPLSLEDEPTVTQSGTSMWAKLPLTDGGNLVLMFHEKEMKFTLTCASSHPRLGLQFGWVPQRSTFRDIVADQLNYCFRGFDYMIRVVNGFASETINGVKLISDSRGDALRMVMNQKG